MVTIWKAAAIAILSAILCVTIGKTEKDIAVVLSAAACCGIVGLAIYSLSDVITFLWQLSNLSDLEFQFTGTLLKVAGVAVISEMTALLSVDAGSSSLEKAMVFLGNAMILSLSLPMFERLVEILQEILSFV